MKQKTKPSQNPTKPAINSVFTSSNLRNLIGRYDFIVLFVLLFLVYNTVTGIGVVSGDTTPASLLPIEIITNHNLYLDSATAYINNPDYSYAFSYVQGHYLSLFPIVTPVLVTPIYILSYILCGLLSVPFGGQYLFILAGKTSAACVASLAGVFVYLAGKELFSKKIAVITTVIFAFATSTWSISSQALWQHGMVELLFAALLYLSIKNTKQDSWVYILAMGIVTGFFVFNRPPDAILLIPILFYILWYQRQRIHIYLVGSLIAGLPFLYYNYTFFGNVFGGYSENLSLFAFNSSFGIHYLGLLISPNVGLFIYCPVLILSLAGIWVVWKRKNSPIKNVMLVAGLAVLLEVLLYSFFTLWYSSASFCFGPRFLTGLVPVLCLYIGYFLDDWFGSGASTHQVLPKKVILILVGGLVMSSLCIQFIGTYYYGWSPTSNMVMSEDRAWNLTDSVIVNSYTIGSHEVPAAFVYIVPPLPPLYLYYSPEKAEGNLAT
jgi:4-amino-4-deoxy-L-arabinose transferase and related glycosyltransferases of PMT family